MSTLFAGRGRGPRPPAGCSRASAFARSPVSCRRRATASRAAARCGARARPGRRLQRLVGPHRHLVGPACEEERAARGPGGRRTRVRGSPRPGPARASAVKSRMARSKRPRAWWGCAALFVQEQARSGRARARPRAPAAPPRGRNARWPRRRRGERRRFGGAEPPGRWRRGSRAPARSAGPGGRPGRPRRSPNRRVSRARAACGGGCAVAWARGLRRGPRGRGSG